MSPDIKRRRNLKVCTPMSASECADDRISKLSDTTLAHILSFLDVKEAAQCDVLSSRWMGLWKRITRLDFDASKQLYKLHTATPDEKQLLRGSGSKYRKWVNQVLTLHKSPTVDEFRVQFILTARASNDIDQWIKFAISKRVKKLHIDLNSFNANKYIISPEFCHYLMSPTNLSDVKHLTSLTLNDVNISGELVEYFVSNCPHLERLDVSYSTHLVNLRIVGPSLRLKYLRLHICTSLESIELSAPKLTTFYHYGKPPAFLIGNNPLLSELIIGGSSRPRVNHALDAFSDLVTQLENLKFSFHMTAEKEKFQVAEFTKLRQLTLEVANGAASLMPLADFIFAAPSLKKLTLQLYAVGTDSVSCRPRAKRLVQRHLRLKVIEVSGFRGGHWLMQLLDFLFVNTARLKKVVIDPYQMRESRIFPAGTKRGEEIVSAQETAYKFKESLPSGVKLVVMDAI